MYISKKLLAIATAALFGSALTFPAYAETISGKLETADSDSIDGWAWDEEDFNHVVNVELQIIPDGSKEAVKTLTTTADNFREDLHVSIKDGWHGFSCPVDWDTIEGDAFTITAYMVTEKSRTQIPETITYKKIQIIEPNMAAEATIEETVSNQAPVVEPAADTTPAVSGETAKADDGDEAYGPAFGSTAASSGKTTIKKTSSAFRHEIGPGVTGTSTGKKGQSLGMFTTTGYCNCAACSDGHNLTYGGTVPTANHTISADLDILPLGTRVMIGDIIYTVEDKGSSVLGNKIDIFYSSHQAAWNHGTQQEEVFLVE